MPAQITSVTTYAAGAVQWTNLATSLASFRDTARAPDLRLSALASADLENPPVELLNFVMEASRGFARSQFENATVAAGTSFLNPLSTILLLEKFLQAFKNRGLSREGARFGSTAAGFTGP